VVNFKAALRNHQAIDHSINNTRHKSITCSYSVYNVTDIVILDLNILFSFHKTALIPFEEAFASNRAVETIVELRKVFLPFTKYDFLSIQSAKLNAKAFFRIIHTS
jgi:hypothetical protein